jgi:hypothetical protein
MRTTSRQVPLAGLSCARNVKFNDREDCAGKGLISTGFAAIDPAGRARATVRFRER